MNGLLQNLSFETPWAVMALLSLPVIWWLLRFVPPRPQQVNFPPTRILLELQKKEETPDKMPWWLLLLRLLMAALLIFGVGHILFSSGSMLKRGSNQLLLVMDDGWTSARNWTERQDYVAALLQDAQRNDTLVTLATSSPRASAAELAPRPASDVLEMIRAMKPRALAPDRDRLIANLKKSSALAPGQIIWISDGINDASAKVFSSSLASLYPQSARTVIAPLAKEIPVALANARLEGADIVVDVLNPRNEKRAFTVQARAGDGHVLAETSLDVTSTATARISLPIELRNAVQSLVIAGQDQAGARLLLDDRWRRKTVALLSGESSEDAQPLLSPLHYVSRALEPFAEITEPENADGLQPALDAGLSMLVLADIGQLSETTHEAVAKWVEGGGLLVRFAGVRMAAASDDLVPVRLREGGRQLGSALSWETPQSLQAFMPKTPFDGITVDPTIKINRQVLAEPDATLAEATWASLADGTPLVTASKRGKGLIVLFHVTANADWSSLPLSGTFAEMLRRLTDIAPAAGTARATQTAVSQLNESFLPRLMLSGGGELVTPEPEAKPISTSVFDRASADAMPGLYSRNGLERAINIEPKLVDLTPMKDVGNGFTQAGFEPPDTFSLARWFFIPAFLLFLADCLASLWVGGSLGGNRTPITTAAAALLIGLAITPVPPAHAGDPQAELEAALHTRLAYVKTGDSEIDQISEQGLKGLTLIMSDRTSADLAEPVGIDPETDELVFYPVLYWPVSESASEPSAAALTRIDDYMKRGGTIFFDLRNDGFDSGSLQGGGSTASEALRRILGKLNVPPLEPVAEQHVLTRSFYLLDDFPGRYVGGKLWVQAGASGQAQDPNTADGVSSVIIGSNDYAAAWALDDNFNPLYAVSGGDDRQREFAFRTGVNIVMYAMTGNYKADQVHIPALLERLGQ